MRAEWVIIEIIAVLVETAAVVYFINSKFASKYNTHTPQLIFWLALASVGVFSILHGLQVGAYETISFLFMIIFLSVAKDGRMFHKILNIVILFTVLMGTTLIGVGLASLIANVAFEHSFIYQDTSRLLSLIFVKALQVVVLFTLAGKHLSISSIKKKSTLFFFMNVIVVLGCFVLIFMNIHEFDYFHNSLLMWMSVALLAILIIMFVLFDLYVREEANNIELSAKLQRIELEDIHFRETSAIHGEIRKWRHEYNNNIIALNSLIEHDKKNEALKYIEKMSQVTYHDEITLHTGNLVLDAVVSSKLWLANSKGIEVNVHAVYPENNRIESNDLCAIVGNLLDNSIEACSRIEDTGTRKFVSFSLLAKGKNMVISVSNSYEGELKKSGDHYITNKENSLGFGLRYIDSIVSEYSGHIVREHTSGVFDTHIIIPLVTIREVN
ncbi:MAG: GHKL domain-containing protein [Oscillospiraceae bacterium]|nr:GHKL domain-containing protein [Oscillospiraceae bacterium]